MPDSIWLLVAFGLSTAAFLVGYLTGYRFGYDSGWAEAIRRAAVLNLRRRGNEQN